MALLVQVGLGKLVSVCKIPFLSFGSIIGKYAKLIVGQCKVSADTLQTFEMSKDSVSCFENTFFLRVQVVYLTESK